MAVTVTKPNSIVDDVWGRHRVTVIRVQFDNDYAPGGEAIDLAAHAPNADPNVTPLFVACEVEGAAAELWVAFYDYVNEKLILAEQSDSDNNLPLSDAEDNLDASGVFVRLLVVFA